MGWLEKNNMFAVQGFPITQYIQWPFRCGQFQDQIPMKLHPEAAYQHGNLGARFPRHFLASMYGSVLSMQSVMQMVIPVHCEVQEVLPKRMKTWWRHQRETFSALLALCKGNSSATGEFRSQRPATRNFEVFFDLCLNKRLSKPARRRSLETSSHSLWRHFNGGAYFILQTDMSGNNDYLRLLIPYIKQRPHHNLIFNQCKKAADFLNFCVTRIYCRYNWTYHKWQRQLFLEM